MGELNKKKLTNSLNGNRREITPNIPLSLDQEQEKSNAVEPNLKVSCNSNL
jgi:hypothetical protein